MKDYKVVMVDATTRGKAVEELNKQVASYVKKGWKPFGSIVVDVDNVGTGIVFLFQTLVLDDIK